MTKTKQLIGAGVGVAVVAALGTYFLYGKNGARNREKIAGWMLKLKGEVLEKVEEIKNLNEQEYYQLVDEISGRYVKLGKVGAEEVKHLAAELKGAWNHLKEPLDTREPSLSPAGMKEAGPKDCAGCGKD